MARDGRGFDAVVFAALAAAMGVAYAVGGMLALFSETGGGALVLGNSVVITTVVSVLLLFCAGAFFYRQRWTRFLAGPAFVAVVLFGAPSLGDLRVVAVAQTAFAVIATVYLVFRNPVPRRERSNVDESTSTHRVGSTLR